MSLTAYIFAFFIGITLGVLGSGGTILTVPLLVYLLHVEPVNATHYSMFIVAVTACVGVALRYGKQKPDLRTAIQFLIPSVLTLYLARKFMLPAIPENIRLFERFVITKSDFLMTLFALVMIVVAYSMIKGFTTPEKLENASNKNAPHATIYFIVAALLIGVLTGLLGAGGGFVIIPTLVYLKRNTMQSAVSTSLFIITVNSILGFASDIHNAVDWQLVFSIALISVGGMLAGWKISGIIPNEKLKKIFGYAVLFIGIFIVIKEWI